MKFGMISIKFTVHSLVNGIVWQMKLGLVPLCWNCVTCLSLNINIVKIVGTMQVNIKVYNVKMPI